MASPLYRRLLLFTCVLALAVARVCWQRREPTPRVVHLGAPVRVADASFDSVSALAPSPDGKLVALGMQISWGATWNGKPFIVLYSLGQKKEVARLKVSSGESDFAWDEQNRLWIERGKGWDVWQAPWKASKRVEARIPAQVWKEAGGIIDAFEPQSQTVALCPSDDNSSVLIELWRGGKHLFDVKSLQTQSGGSIAGMEWSPDGKQLAFSLGGWIAYEQEGAHELWVLDMATHQTRCVARGDAEWALADPHTQDTDPSWSRDGKTLFWGDQEFGINATAVQSGNTRQILSPKWAGNVPLLLPSGRAFVCVRYAQPGQGGMDTFVAAATDGSWWARGPQVKVSAPVATSPTRDELLFLAPDGPGTIALWKWDISPESVGLN